MKINLLNKIYIGMAISLLLGTVYKTIAYKSWDRYYYYSSVCAPTSYPIYIRECYFITPDEDDNAWINNEKAREFSSEWGDEGFPEVRDQQRLPEKMVLQYASYRDKKFYSDTLALPEQLIRTVFKSAEKQNQLEEIFKSGGDVKGLKFLVGIANDGNIILWIRGKFLDKIILKTKIVAKEPKGDQTYFEKRLPKNVYLTKVFENLSDSLKNKIRSGWDSNANYIDTPTHYIDRNKESWRNK